MIRPRLDVSVDPLLLVLGGSVGARPDFADKVARALLQLSPRPVEIRTSTLGRRAGVVGALSVAFSVVVGVGPGHGHRYHRHAEVAVHVINAGPIAEHFALQDGFLVSAFLIALALSVPVLNLLAPLFGTALMVHLFKSLPQR